jgi:D-amino-acid dehydrogenase
MSEASAGTAIVIGAGIVGASCGLFLQRDGWHVRLVDPRPPGSGASLGNAGVISLGSVLPIATPGLVGEVPRMLRDPLGPLAIRWRYLPRLLPWLLRAALATRPERAEASSKAIAALVERAERAHDLVIQQCGLADLVRRAAG